MDQQRNIVAQGSCPYSDLVSLAMILVFKDVSHVSLKQAEVISLLLTAAAELKSNPNLKIDIPNSDQTHNITSNKATTLLDLYAEHAAEYNCTKSFATEQEESVNESVQKILDNLIDTENEKHIHLFKSIALSNAIEKFLRNLLKACGIAIKDIKDLIEKAKEKQAEFVIPSNLHFPPKICAALGTLH